MKKLEKNKQKKGKAIQFIKIFKILPHKTKIIFYIEVVLLLCLSLFPSIILDYEIEIFEKISLDNLELKHIMLILIFIVCLLVINSIVDYLYCKFSYKFGYEVRNIFNKQMFEKMRRIDLIELEDPNFYDVLNRIRDTMSSEFIGFITGFFLIIKNIFVSFSVSVVIWQLHWSFPIIIIIGTIPYVFFFKKLNFNHYFTIMDNSTKTRKNHYIIRLLTGREFANEIKTYNLFDYLYDRHKVMRNELFDETYSLVKKYTFYAAILSLFKRVLHLTCLIICIYLILIGKRPVGYFVILIESLSTLQSAFSNIIMKYKDMDRNLYVLNDYLDFNHLSNEKISYDCVDLKNKDIEINNISFDYPSYNDVLKNINLKIPFGQKIAIVGENGSGKSTLMSLLMGVYSPKLGNVYIGGIEIEKCKSLFRNKTSFLFQNFIKFKGTIKDNIVFGNNKISDNEIEQVFYELDNGEFLSKMPKGIYTNVGFLEENSIEISGGEWQKIAFVRALINKEIDFIILDEFASALDAKTEANIYEKMNKLLNNKTVISISHRMGITKNVDRIVVLNDGKIVEDGTHNELMKNKSYYYKMYISQRKLYE